MSKKQWFLLWLIFIGYLFLGATIFYYLERKVEIEIRHLQREEQREIEDLLRQNYAVGAPTSQRQIFSRLGEYCKKPFTITRKDINESQYQDDEIEHENEKPFIWTYYNSFFFALTTLSTIGYGNLSPTTMEGRVLVILYSLIGIPLNGYGHWPLKTIKSRMIVIIYSLIGIPLSGIVLSNLGDFYATTFLRAHHRYKTHHFETKISLIMDIIMYLIPGIVFFIFIPSGAFVYFEGWSFDESVYYAFVTLTTIGYGDYVAGQTANNDLMYSIYKVLLIIWFMFGLGYLVMILGFIARALRSKKIARLEHAVSHTIKQTQAKIWQEFTSEVTSVRRMLNEMYFLKFKPVYRDKEKTSPLLGTRQRSRSAPELTEWPVLRKKEPEPEPEDLEAAFKSQRNQRRRAVSENVMHEKPKRVMSDSEINNIDRTATFRSATPVEPGILLARVIDAIGTPIPTKSPHPMTSSPSDSEDENVSRRISDYMNGINMFSDSEILASEYGNGVRKRTLSEALSIPSNYSYDEQQTWSGTDYNNYKHKHSLSHDPMPIKTETKSQSDHLPTPASGLRRMSMAAINFLTPSNRNRKSPSSRSFSEEQPTKSKERKQSQSKDKKRRTGNSNILLPQAYLQKHRYSLQDDDYEHGSYMDEINYLSCTAGRRPSLLATLAQELGPKRDSTASISPVLEQTSVADFIRVLSTLQSRLENSEMNLDHVASSSPLSNSAKQSNQSLAFNSSRSSPLRQSKSKKEMFHSTSALESDVIGQTEAINPSLVEKGEMKRRRFSFIPQVDKFPFGKVSSEENVTLYQKKSRSHSITPSHSLGNSNTNLSRPPPVNRRLRRMSSIGQSIKQLRKRSTSASLHKTITPPKLIITTPEGHQRSESHDRFTVTQTEITIPSRKQSTSSASVSWGTAPAASTNSDQSSDKDKSSDNLEDVVVLRL